MMTDPKRRQPAQPVVWVVEVWDGYWLPTEFSDVDEKGAMGILAWLARRYRQTRYRVAKYRREGR